MAKGKGPTGTMGTTGAGGLTLAEAPIGGEVEYRSTMPGEGWMAGKVLDHAKEPEYQDRVLVQRVLKGTTCWMKLTTLRPKGGRVAQAATPTPTVAASATTGLVLPNQAPTGGKLVTATH